MRTGTNHLSLSLPPSLTPPRTTPRILSQQRSPDLFRSGAVRAIPAKDAAAAIKDEGFRLLDIRPAWEREKARVKGSLHVPLFVEDTGVGPIPLVKKWVHFGSLIAVKKLHKEGYKNLGWLAGGFNKASDADFPDVEGTTKLQYATIGGASYFFLQILLLLRVVGNDDK
ncbi:uncharacterized protein A4U43_C05F5230 [Asparagus officinalis]|uniref:Rhodanese domain-containing protein n=1 Tax=Asparagus officinalis TaxID=4686 RepID=A0A5P1EPH2_ASPOF|nr:uncharacterized protein A4U43_C05F5230 [Asparagus officinalis]